MKHWLPALAWMLLVFAASTSLGAPQHTSLFVRPFLLWLNPHMPEGTVEQIHYYIRKTAHFVEYSVLGMLLWRLVRYEPVFAAQTVGRQIRLALLFSALYASSDEFHQLFVSSRQAAVQDVLLDTCGAAFGILAVWLAGRLPTKAP